jgi:hypothetical protein
MDSGNSASTRTSEDLARNIENECDNNAVQILGNCNIFMNNWKNFEINDFFKFISKKRLKFISNKRLKFISKKRLANSQRYRKKIKEL